MLVDGIVWVTDYLGRPAAHDVRSIAALEGVEACGVQERAGQDQRQLAPAGHRLKVVGRRRWSGTPAESA